MEGGLHVEEEMVANLDKAIGSRGKEAAKIITFRQGNGKGRGRRRVVGCQDGKRLQVGRGSGLGATRAKVGEVGVGEGHGEKA